VPCEVELGEVQATHETVDAQRHFLPGQDFVAVIYVIVDAAVLDVGGLVVAFEEAREVLLATASDVAGGQEVVGVPDDREDDLFAGQVLANDGRVEFDLETFELVGSVVPDASPGAADLPGAPGFSMMVPRGMWWGRRSRAWGNASWKARVIAEDPVWGWARKMNFPGRTIAMYLHRTHESARVLTSHPSQDRGC